MWRTTRCHMQIYFIKVCCHNEWRGRRRVLLVLNSKRAPPLFSEMGVLKNSKGSLYTMNVLIIKLVVWLGWLSSVALGQLELSEAVTGFVNFPEVGISCIGNLAVFITSVSKGRLDLEMGARDVLATLRGRKVKKINGVGLTTCENNKDASVVMLSYKKPNSSMRQFMEYISNAHNVHSILLFTSAAADAQLDIRTCAHNHSNRTCKCIVFGDVPEITTLLGRRMPGTLQRLPESLWLLSSEHCLINGCHGCNQERLTGGVSNEELPPPVSEIRANFDDCIQTEDSCICIPLHPNKGPADDKWTKLLTKSFPEVGISCIRNLAVFITSVSKGSLDLEMAVRDVLATVRGRKVYDINNGANPNPVGFTTCEDSGPNRYEKASVVMLSDKKPNLSMRQFMEYISIAHNVHSILLFTSAAAAAHLDERSKCNCNNSNHTCKCIVFGNVQEITTLLDSQMPGTVKQLSDSQCLLPSKDCLIGGCHGCNLPPPVSEILANFDYCIQKENTCICFPLHGPADDKWTELLTKSFRTKDNEERRASAMASDAMENYTAQEPKGTRMAWIRGRKDLREGLIVEFRTPSLILPRLTEILINFLLVGWFRVDGFSTSMVARKAVKKYVVGSQGSGFAANAFLTKALVKSWNTRSYDINDNDTHICQVLTFRGPLLSLRTLSFIAGAVNVLCSIFWVVFIAYEGSVGKRYDIHSMPPSIPTVAVIIVAIFIALGMDGLHLYLYWKAGNSKMVRPLWPVCAVIVLEIMCIASGSIAAGVLGIKPFKKWVYSALQVLVWVKWGIGSYLLGELHSNSNSEYNWTGGILVYSSAFFLNFILAAVRCKWKYSP